MATFYWIVQLAAVANPTRAQIVAGLNGAGAAAIASGSVADTGQASPVDAAADVTGLTAGTSYEVAWVWWDGSSESGVVVGAFSTLTAHTSTGALAAQSATRSTTQRSG